MNQGMDLGKIVGEGKRVVGSTFHFKLCTA